MTWKLENGVASLNVPGVTGRLALAEPFHGLADVRIDGELVAHRLLAVGADASGAAAEWPVADAYVRGADLVVTYRETPTRPFTVQISWSIVAAPPARVALDAVVSVQTALLDSHPKFSLHSVVPGDGSHTARTCVAYRDLPLALLPASANWSIAEAAPPTDFAPPHLIRSRSSAGESATISTRWSLEQDFMEKGVIRRVRVRALVLAVDDAVCHAERASRDLSAAEPVLTT